MAHKTILIVEDDPMSQQGNNTGLLRRGACFLWEPRR